MDEKREVPPIVQHLAEQVGMTPFDWRIHPDHVVIVFEQGPKRTFQIEPTEKPTVKKIKEKEPILSAPSAPSTEHLLDAPPAVVAKPKAEPKKRKKE